MALPMTRRSYHHGDLRNALTRAAVELAEKGGPDAVSIRAAARVVGVTPTAAYRHFSGHDELLASAKDLAIAGLAGAMRERLAAVRADADPVRNAVHRVAALGQGYLQFALAEPGLFSTAFCLGEPVPLAEVATDDDHPFGMLAKALDEMVAVGYLDTAHRPLAEISAWSLVHGLANLIVEGPLGELSGQERGTTVHLTTAFVLRGLGTGPNAEPTRSTDPVCTGAAPVPSGVEPGRS